MASARKLASTTTPSIGPFLYQTRTLAAPLRNAKPYSSTTTDPNEPDTNNLANANTNLKPRDPRQGFLQRHAAARINRATPLRQTQNPRGPAAAKARITLGEKKAFKGLLKQIEQSNDETTAGENTEGEGGSKSRGRTKTRISGEQVVRISSLFDSILANYRGKRRMKDAKRQRAEFGDREGVGEEDEPRVDISEVLGEEGKNLPMGLAVKKIVRRETGKIEDALMEAIQTGKGDMGVWEVCQVRIFSILEHIGFGAESAAEEERSSQYEKEEEEEENAEEEEVEKAPLEIPAAISKEPVIIALYPRALLIAFRLLHQHFLNSPLIGQFRSMIQSHGRASAILGTSTDLYNELINFYWNGCGDIAGAVTLLHEMEVTGVEPNARTLKVLDNLLKQRKYDLVSNYHVRRGREEEGQRHGAQVPGQVNREPWWDMAPNRRAVRELSAKGGWMDRLRARVKKVQMDRQGVRST